MKINVVEKSKLTFLISLAIILIGVVMFFVRGINYGLDFAGGNVVSVQFENNEFETNKVKQAFINAGAKKVTVARTGDNKAIVRTNFESAEKTEEINNKAIENLPYENVEIKLNDTIKNTADSSLLVNALIIIGITLVVIYIYALIRFGSKAAIASVIGAIHDILLTVSVVIIVGVPFTVPSIIAIYAVVAFSIHMTMLVVGRILEEQKNAGKKFDIKELVNNSVNSISCKLINSAALGIVLFIALFIFGNDGIKEFAIYGAIGFIVAAYSSIFISGAILSKFGNTKPAAAKEWYIYFKKSIICLLML